MSEFAQAWPTKRFFLEMFVRDISLEDAILDLVDNSVDSLARTKNIPLSESLLDPKVVQRISARMKSEGLPKIDVQITQAKFSISDNCGGIDYEQARDEIFHFGRVSESKKSRLSVYGVGLKRAIFKMGRDITVSSQTQNSGFVVKIDTDAWAKSDKDNTFNADDWRFPITKTAAARSQNSAGTDIEITRLNENIKLRVGDGQLESHLHEVVSSAYALILDHFVILRINGARVRPKQIPLGLSPKVTPAKTQFEANDTKVTIIAGLADRDEWKAENAGWYVLCNGRVVVFADKSETTGWGVGSGQFVPKYRGFVGIVFFFSETPEALPWTTTKRGLNRESQVFRLARNKMSVLSRPVLSFLNSMYPGDAEGEEPEERGIANTVKRAELSEVMKSSSATFTIKHPPGPPKIRYVSIQYKVKMDDLEKVRRAKRKPNWSATAIGSHTFQYFLERECS